MKVLKPIIFFLLSFSLWLPLFGMEEQTPSRKRKRDESALTHQESAYVLISQTGGSVQINKSLLKRARLFEKVMNDADQTDKSIPTQLSQEAIEFVEDFLRFLERLEQALERKMHNKKNAKIVYLEEKKQKKINFFNTLKDYYLYKHANLINSSMKKKMQNIKHQLKQFDKPEKLLGKKQKDLEQKIKTLDDVLEIKKREKLTKKIHNFLKQKATSFREFLNLAEIGDYIGCEILFESAIDLAATQINDDAAREIISMLSPAIATALYEKIKQSIIEKKYLLKKDIKKTISHTFSRLRSEPLDHGALIQLDDALTLKLQNSLIDISETMAVSCDGKHTAQIASQTALTLVIGNLEEGTKKQVSFKKEEEKEACPPDTDDAFFLGFTEPKIVSYIFTDDNQHLEVTVQNINTLLIWNYVLETGQKILKDKITLPHENCTFLWKSSASPAIFLHKKELLKQESVLFFGTTSVAIPHTTKELFYAFNNNHSLMLVYSDVKEQIVVLDTQTGDALKTIDCPGMIQALTFGPDATTGAAVVRTNTNCAITIFDITTGAHVSSFDITDSLKRCHKKPKSTMNLALTNKHAILSLGLSKHDRTTIVYERALGTPLKGISHPMTNILPDGSLITLDQATNCFGDMTLSISYTLDATQEALKDLNDCSLHDLCVIEKIIQYPCNQLTADDQAVFDNLPESLKKLR